MKTQYFTYNTKTLVSIDFDRTKTCLNKCAYCYVATMERIYKAYGEKIKENYKVSFNSPETFATQLNSEYRKLRQSKSKNWKRLSKLPVRIYGSGDYIPIHYKFLSKLDFKFYIISKTLTSPLMKNHIEELLKLNNLTKIVLSFDSTNLKNYDEVKDYFGKDRIAFSYTGMPKEFENVTERFDIFFNISDKKIDKEYTRNLKEQCPCDSGLLVAKEACTHCNKCWRSSKTKDHEWNKH